MPIMIVVFSASAKLTVFVFGMAFTETSGLPQVSAPGFG